MQGRLAFRGVSMRLFSIEAINMGKHQVDITEKVWEMVSGLKFESQQEFNDIETQLIQRSFRALGLCAADIPKKGVLIPRWEVKKPT